LVPHRPPARAREDVRVARALRELPQIGEALRRGQISYSKVRALTRVASAENEAALLMMARSSTAMRAQEGRPENEEDERWFREGETGTGFVRFDIQVRTEEAALLRRALETAASRAWSRDVPAGTRAVRLRLADALVAVGRVVPRGVGRRGAAHVLDVGRRRRTIPTLLRRALRLRDRGCRFPGCTNRRVDGHHTVPWSQGGATSLRNLVSLCRRHHTYVHEYGMRIVTDDDTLRFVRRDGTVVPTCDARTDVVTNGPEAIEACNVGLGIDAMTGDPKWGDYRRPDYGHIVWTLMQSATSHLGPPPRA
jgi:hypothetical protein